MRVAPTAGIQAGCPPCFIDPDQRIVQRETRHVGQVSFGADLQDIAPAAAPVHMRGKTRQ